MVGERDARQLRADGLAARLVARAEVHRGRDVAVLPRPHVAHGVGRDPLEQRPQLGAVAHLDARHPARRGHAVDGRRVGEALARVLVVERHLAVAVRGEVADDLREHLRRELHGALRVPEVLAEARDLVPRRVPDRGLAAVGERNRHRLGAAEDHVGGGVGRGVVGGVFGHGRRVAVARERARRAAVGAAPHGGGAERQREREGARRFGRRRVRGEVGERCVRREAVRRGDGEPRLAQHPAERVAGRREPRRVDGEVRGVALALGAVEAPHARQARGHRRRLRRPSGDDAAGHVERDRAHRQRARAPEVRERDVRAVDARERVRRGLLVERQHHRNAGVGVCARVVAHALVGLVGGVELTHDLAGPREARVAAPAVPSLPPFALLAPRLAALVAFVALEEREHPAHGVGRQRLAVREVAGAGDPDGRHAALALRLLGADLERALRGVAGALRRPEVDVVVADHGRLRA